MPNAGARHRGQLTIRNEAIVDGQQIAGDFAHGPSHHVTLFVDAGQLHRLEALLAESQNGNVSGQARNAGVEQRPSVTHALAHDVAAVPHAARGSQNRQG